MHQPLHDSALLPLFHPQLWYWNLQKRIILLKLAKTDNKLLICVDNVMEIGHFSREVELNWHKNV